MNRKTLTSIGDGENFVDYTRDELHLKWASIKNILKYQPINLVRNYFGEEIALHFAWVGMFLTSLWIPSLFGIVFFFVGLQYR